MSNELAIHVPFSDIERMAMALSKSRLFGIQTPEQAIALMLLAQAEGLHPATAARDYDIIQGRPALKTVAMLARFQAAGGRVEWLELTDTSVTGRFTHALGGTVDIQWDMARAKQAQLTGKDNWHKYPRQMLRSRVIAEGLRTVYPGVLQGLYSVEEVADFEPRQDTAEPEPPKQIIPEAEVEQREFTAIRSEWIEDKNVGVIYCEDRCALLVRTPADLISGDRITASVKFIRNDNNGNRQYAVYAWEPLPECPSILEVDNNA